MLSAEIVQIAEREYRYIGRPQSFHSFADLGQLLPALSNPVNQKRKFLDGAWVWEFAGKRRRQLEETADALSYRLRHEPGALAGIR